ncbi:hypothetical protein M3Y99_00892300 [Aphelenchoides fujianensis]|nr:hypothetical protein M3Y99_00892300 [Aphelenchoides fujianensis]
MEDPDMNASARSLGDSSGEQGAEWMQSDRRSLRRKLEEAQSELYELKRALPFLDAVDPENPEQSFRSLAQQCADLAAERDALFAERAQMDDEHRADIQRADDAIADLQRQVREIGLERDEVFDKCIQLERQLDEHHSVHCRTELEHSGGSRSSAHRRRRRDAAVEESRSSDSSTKAHLRALQITCEDQQAELENRAGIIAKLQELLGQMDKQLAERNAAHEADCAEVERLRQSMTTPPNRRHPLDRERPSPQVFTFDVDEPPEGDGEREREDDGDDPEDDHAPNESKSDDEAAKSDSIESELVTSARGLQKLEARIREAAKRSGFKMPFPPQ